MRLFIAGFVVVVAGLLAGCGEGPSVDEPTVFAEEAKLWVYTGDAPSPGSVREMPGPEHCGWERSVFLVYDVEENALYLRDPEGVTVSWAGELAGLDLDATLPAEAVDTGYRDGRRQLWAAPDLAFVYVVEGERVERWPRIPGEWRLCA